MSWGIPIGNGKIVKLGDPAKEGFVREAQGVYLGRRDGEYNNQLYDFATPDGQITIPGSAALDNTITDGYRGKLLRLVYEGDVATKKGKPMKKITVTPWLGTLPPEYQALADAATGVGDFAEMPAALAEDKDDSLPF